MIKKKKTSMSFKRILDYLIRIGSILIILEPVWMLLPFAGFLYGSVLNLEFLKNSYYTIWLLCFIFPVQSLMPVAIVLSVTGLSVFLVGAFQVYFAKIRKSGMVKTGLYKKVRHPQYTGLILFCIGILLMWGRFIAYIVFFLVTFLYYLLAKKEEKICLSLFGKEYEDYKKTTYFLFPAERVFSNIGKLFSSFIPKRAVGILVSFLLLMTIGIGSCFTILSIRISSMRNIPFSKTRMSFRDCKGSFQDLNVMMIKGFGHHIRGLNISDEGKLSGDFLRLFTSSEKMRQVLKGIYTKKINTLLCFLISRTVREKRSYYNKGKGDIFVILLDSPIELLNDNNFNDLRNRWKVLGALEITEFDMRKITEGGDPIKGEIAILKPFNRESIVNFQKRIEAILNIYLSGLRKKTLPFNKIFERRR